MSTRPAKSHPRRISHRGWRKKKRAFPPSGAVRVRTGNDGRVRGGVIRVPERWLGTSSDSLLCVGALILVFPVRDDRTDNPTALELLVCVVDLAKGDLLRDEVIKVQSSL